MDSAKGSFAKVFGQRIVGLSEFAWSMSKLAEFLKRTGACLHEMLAQLGLVLLFESVELALIAIEIVIIALLSQMTQNLGRRVVKVAWSTILVTLVISSLTFLGSIGGLVLLLNSKVHTFGLNW